MVKIKFRKIKKLNTILAIRNFQIRTFGDVRESSGTLGVVRNSKVFNVKKIAK